MNAVRFLLVLAMLLCVGVGPAMAAASYPGLVYVGSPETLVITPDTPALGTADDGTTWNLGGDDGDDTGEGDVTPSDS